MRSVASENQVSSTESILDLAKVRDWQSVILRCQTNPTESARTKGKLNETALHWICFHGCPLQAVEALIKVDPESLVSVDRYGKTPLHVLCSRYWKHVSGMQLSDKDSIIKYVLKENELVLNMRDRQGLTPMQVLWIEFEKSISMNICGEEQDFASFSTKVKMVIDLFDQMFRTKKLNEGICPSRPWSLLNEVILDESLPKTMRRSFVNISTEICPELVSSHTENEEGNKIYPLHTVINSESYPGRSKEVHANGNILQPVSDQFFDLSCLVRAYPEASMKKDGRNARFPLFIALEKNYTWTSGIHDLFQANPNLLGMKDGRRGMFAFQVAAVGENTDLNTVYNLLRTFPCVMNSTEC